MESETVATETERAINLLLILLNKVNASGKNIITELVLLINKITSKVSRQTTSFAIVKKERRERSTAANFIEFTCGSCFIVNAIWESSVSNYEY